MLPAGCQFTRHVLTTASPVIFVEATGQFIRPFRVMWIMVEKRSFCKFHIDTEIESERRHLIAVYL